MAPKVSVLQLDTDFPRVAGDVGCTDTYIGEVEIIRIGGATVANVVRDRPDLIDIAPFEDALHRASSDIVVTSCGFLSYWQDHLAAETDKVFISSALTALSDLSQTYERNEVLILTFDSASLTPLHLGKHKEFAEGIIGLPQQMHLRKVISGNQTFLDTILVSEELTRFIAANQRPHHKHLLLECTNLPPYKAAMQKVTGLPVSDILTVIEANHQGIIQPQFLT